MRPATSLVSLRRPFTGEFSSRFVELSDSAPTLET